MISLLHLLHHLPHRLPDLPHRTDLGTMVRETKRLQTLRGLVGTRVEEAEAGDLETMARRAVDPEVQVAMAR